jgi:hypothetical protein
MKHPDEFAAITWGDLRVGDFVRASASHPLFKVVSRDGSQLTLLRPPHAPQVGRPRADAPCEVRILADGKKTEAGLRFAYLGDEKIRLLKEELGAEMLSVYDTEAAAKSKTFTPHVLPGLNTYAPSSLSGHLFQFHGLFVGAPPKDKELLKELHETHSGYHAHISRIDAKLRVPHIHNQSEFERLFQ